MDKSNLLVMNLLVSMCSISSSSSSSKGKGKGKVLPRTSHEVPGVDKMYSSTLPSTSALDRGGWKTPRPGRFSPDKDLLPIA